MPLTRTATTRTTSAPVPGQAAPWLRWLRRHRRGLAAIAVGGAVLLVVRALQPPAAATVPVLVTSHPVAAGAELGPDDVQIAQWPPALAPAAAVTDLAQLPSNRTVGPLTAGEPVVPTRLLSGQLLAGYGADLVAAPVRLADAGAAALLHPGDLVDVLAAAPATVGANDSPARAVATAVRVLLIPAPASASGVLGAGPSDGTLIVLLTTPAIAAALAGAAATARLSIVLRTPADPPR